MEAVGTKKKKKGFRKDKMGMRMAKHSELLRVASEEEMLGHSPIESIKLADVRRGSAEGLWAKGKNVKAVRKHIAQSAFQAFLNIQQLAVGATNEMVRLNANKDILDRAGYKPVEQLEVSGRGEQVNKLESMVADLLGDKPETPLDEKELDEDDDELITFGANEQIDNLPEPEDSGTGEELV